MLSVSVTLPGGFMAEGRWHRQALVRPVNGEDEDILRTVGSSLFPAQRLTLLLARCVEQLGPWRPVTPDQVQGLAAGDRDALALHVRRITLGDRMGCVLTCPACGKRMDLDLSASALLCPPYAWEGEWHEAAIGQDDGRQVYRLRVPNGGDLESAASLAWGDLEVLESILLRACVTSSAGEAVGNLSAAAQGELAARLADLDPQAELVIDMTCAHCGTAIQMPFDPAAFLFEELAARAETLYREVHTLALHYHWSERDILTMTEGKRRLYLQLLNDAPGQAGGTA